MNTVQAYEHLNFHPALKKSAQLISFLFHPLFIPVYLGWFFIYELRLFPARDAWQQKLLLIQFAVNYTFLPLVTVLITKGVGFIQSIYLRNQRDRIIPYITSMIFYFWVWYVFKNQQFPKEVVMFSLAVFLTSSLGLIFNNYFKVSMHALSIGVVMTFMFIQALTHADNYGIYLSITLFISGLVCTARLVNADHRPFDVYAGLGLGALAQVVAWLFV